MVKKFASFLLSTLSTTVRREALGNDKTPPAKPAARRVLARQGWASENDGLFEHPVGCSGMIHDPSPVRGSQGTKKVFQQPAGAVYPEEIRPQERIGESPVSRNNTYLRVRQIRY